VANDLLGRADAGRRRRRAALARRALTPVLVVVDASVVVQIAVTGGDLGPLTGHALIAPPLLRADTLSSLAELAFRGEIPPDAARSAALRVADIDIGLERPATLDARAWDVARSLGWAKTYDAEYVALALIREAPLLTLDGRLRRAAGHLVSMPRIVELGGRR
jgi:predicted nucleic acid-binding protein